MPTFREDIKLGSKVPLLKTDDINDQAITKDKIRDGNVTTEKLADGAVKSDKISDASITTSKIANGNITEDKLDKSAVTTSKIADQSVTTEKIADQSVNNAKLSPSAVTYDKIKDSAVITEKLNDRAVTTEKVEEKAITNPKLGDQAVDGRVIREASIETKHIANDSVTSDKLAEKSVTSSKLVDQSVDGSKLADGSVGNQTLADDSVTKDKIKDGSITNEKLADGTLKIDKLDPELRKTIGSATGLPEDLTQMIQDIDETLKNINDTDEKQQAQINDNTDDIESLKGKSDQLEQSIKDISVSGGASTANAVSYNNESSGLDAINAQEAIDELANKKFDKSNVAQELGDSEEKVVSQSALPLRMEESEEWTYLIKDAEDHVLFGIQQNGNIEWSAGVPAPIRSKFIDLISRLNTKVDKEEGKSLIDDELQNSFKITNSEEWAYLIKDAEDHVLFGIQQNGNIVGEVQAVNVLKESLNALSTSVEKTTSDVSKLNNEVKEFKNVISNQENVVLRNKDKLPALLSACRYDNGKHDIQLCLITDSHGNELAVNNAVSLVNNINCIDGIIHCGDIVSTRFDKEQISNFKSDIRKCKKPWFIVVGNHDVGNTMYISYSATHEEVYDNFIKPMVVDGVLKDNEYQEGKAYYYHDFTSRKIRIIVIYEYDNPLDVAENEYWDETSYNSTYPQLIPGQSYQVGDKVNCGGYRQSSFICKKNVSTIDNQYDETYTIPYYKAGRAVRCIRKEQIEWFINTLNDTPDGYGVVVATHNPAMIESSNQPSFNFASNIHVSASNAGQYGMKTDVLSQIINAFINKSAGSVNVEMKEEDVWKKANLSYLNTLGSDGNKYSYTVNYDFTNIANSFFLSYIGGHLHVDLVFKHNNYDKQYSINPICAATDSGNRFNSDIVNTEEDSICHDALTCVSFEKDKIKLSRLGNTLSVSGKHRDFEIINIV